MDHDDKIVSSDGESRQEVNLFLQDFMGSLKSEGAAPYELEAEYAKTRKNRSWFVFILIACLIVVIVAGTWFFSSIISKQSRDVPVGIEAFEDLNLRNLLNNVSRAESALQTAVNEKASLEAQKKAELDSLVLKRDADSHLVRSLSLASKEQNTRLAVIDKTYKSGEVSITESYDPKIAEISTRIAELSVQLNVFDPSSVEEARRESPSVNSDRQVFEMEKQQLRDEYESVISDLRSRLADAQESGYKSQIQNLDAMSAKYKKEIAGLDPVIRDSRGSSIVARMGSGTAPVPFADIPSVPGGMNIDPELFSSVHSLYADFEYAAGFVLATPHKNSLPGYVRAMRNLSYTAAGAMEMSMKSLMDFTSAQKVLYEEQLAAERLRAEAAARDFQAGLDAIDGTVKTQDSIISGFEYFMRALLEKSGDTGYVLDPRNKDAILVYIDPLYSTVDTGSRAYVFRSGAEYIGSVILQKEKGYFTARTEEIVAGMQILSNDRILLDIPGGKKPDF